MFLLCAAKSLWLWFILLSFALLAEQDQGGGSAVEVTEDHPEVLAYVQAAVEKFPQDPPPATNEMLVEALSLQVKALHERKVEQGKQQQWVCRYEVLQLTEELSLHSPYQCVTKLRLCIRQHSSVVYVGMVVL